MISTVKTMEDAIEQQKDILGHLGWGEVAGAEKEDLVMLDAETGRFLEEAGLYDPKDKRKREAVAYLRAATQPDISDRANWLKAVSQMEI